jgi:predicted nuclease of predicted toxin-antitoxin system
MKIIIDMNLSPRWVDFFSQHGFEAVHWSKIGSASAPDAEIMGFAKDNGYIIFTHDLDFGAMLAETKVKKPSVVQVRSADIDPPKTAIPIIHILKQYKSEIENGALITIASDKTRIRILPFDQ